MFPRFANQNVSAHALRAIDIFHGKGLFWCHMAALTANVSQELNELLQICDVNIRIAFAGSMYQALEIGFVP